MGFRSVIILLGLLSLSCSYVMNSLKDEAHRCNQSQPTRQRAAQCITRAVVPVEPFEGKAAILSDMKIAASHTDEVASHLVQSVLAVLRQLARSERRNNDNIAAAIVIGAVVVTTVAVVAATTTSGGGGSGGSTSSPVCNNDNDCNSHFCCKERGRYDGVCARPPLGDYTVRPAYDSYKQGTGAYICPR